MQRHRDLFGNRYGGSVRGERKLAHYTTRAQLSSLLSSTTHSHCIWHSTGVGKGACMRERGTERSRAESERMATYHSPPSHSTAARCMHSPAHCVSSCAVEGPVAMKARCGEKAGSGRRRERTEITGKGSPIGAGALPHHSEQSTQLRAEYRCTRASACGVSQNLQQST